MLDLYEFGTFLEDVFIKNFKVLQVQAPQRLIFCIHSLLVAFERHA
jgi:hypothetical protein